MRLQHGYMQIYASLFLACMHTRGTAYPTFQVISVFPCVWRDDRKRLFDTMVEPLMPSRIIDKGILCVFLSSYLPNIGCNRLKNYLNFRLILKLFKHKSQLQFI